MDDLSRAFHGNEFMFEQHAKHGDLRFDRKALAWLNLRKEHGNCHALRRRDAAAATNAKWTFNKGLLCVRVPRVPVLDILVNPEDCFGGRSDCYSVFNLHWNFQKSEKGRERPNAKVNLFRSAKRIGPQQLDRTEVSVACNPKVRLCRTQQRLGIQAMKTRQCMKRHAKGCDATWCDRLRNDSTTEIKTRAH